MCQISHKIFQFLNTKMRICPTEVKQKRKTIRLDKQLPQSFIFRCNPRYKHLLNESSDLNLQLHDVLNEIVTYFFNIFVQEVIDDRYDLLKHKKFPFEVFGCVLVPSDN